MDFIFMPSEQQKFTGSHDMNWRKIKDGDILKPPFDKGRPSLVYYNKELKRYALKVCIGTNKEFDHPFLVDSIAPNTEVIGNVYGTPSLLEDFETKQP